MSRYEQLSVNELTSTGQSICTFGVGAKEGVTAAFKNAYKVTERGNDVVHKTVFTFNDTPITVLDTGTGVGIKIYTFPAGAIMHQGTTGSVAITTTSVLASTLNASTAMTWGVGTTTQVGATLATTEQDFVNSTAITSSATINVAGAVSTVVTDPVATNFDGTSTPIALFLNFAVTTATDIDADASVTVAGSVVVHWRNLGDV